MTPSLEETRTSEPLSSSILLAKEVTRLQETVALSLNKTVKRDWQARRTSASLAQQEMSYTAKSLT